MKITTFLMDFIKNNKKAVSKFIKYVKIIFMNDL